MATLYIVGTPIGNLDDLTYRAAKVLQEVPVVVAEDTRVTRKLLNHVGANPKLLTIHRYSTPGEIARATAHLTTGDVAVVSDAGTPGVNDPGQALVATAVEQGHLVVPIPGPSSIVAALSICGFDADRFTSHGFLPASGSKRRRLLVDIAESSRATVLFETPHRLRSALSDMVTAFGERQIMVCREMTKLHEEIWRGTPDEALGHFENPRGEFAIVVSPPAPEHQSNISSEISDEARDRILAHVNELSDGDHTRRDLAQIISRSTGIPRRVVYQVLHDT